MHYKILNKLNISVVILLLSLPLSDNSDKPEEFQDYIIQEEFNDLQSWENFNFTGKKIPTDFEIIEDSTVAYLKIVSQSSASGLIHKIQFDPNIYPNLSWRWRINNMSIKADQLTKSGDDYPIRIFVLFEDDSADVSFWTSIRNSVVRLLYGTNPPESSLCFIWLNREHKEEYFNNPL